MALDNKNNDRHSDDVSSLIRGNIPRAFPGMVHVMDVNGDITAVTDAWLDVLGYDRDQVLGRPALGLFTPDSRVRMLSTKIDPGGRLTQRLRIYKASGGALDVIVCTAKQEDGDIVFLTDFSAYRAMEDRLLKKQRNLQSYIDGANAGTWEWNVQTGETEYNDRWAEIVGYTKSELEPINIDTWNTLSHPEDKVLADAALQRHFAGETDHYDVEMRLRHKAGHWVWVRDRGRVFTRTPEGAPKRMFGTLFDISDQIRHQTEQRKTARLLDRTGQLAAVGGWELDLEVNKLSWTNELKRIHEVADDYMPTLAEALTFYAPEVRSQLGKAVTACIERGEPYDLELPLASSGGEKVWVRTVGQMEYKDGKPRRINGAVQDITQRVRQTDALMAANQRVALAAGSGGVGTWTLEIGSGTLIWDALMAEHFSDVIQTAPVTTDAWVAALPARQSDQLQSALHRAQTSGEQIDLVLDLPCQGMLRALKIVAAPHYDRAGRVETLQGICLDLTPQRLMTRQLEEQSSRMAVTLSSIGDGVITVDAANRVLWMNPEATRLTGWLLSDAVGKPSRSVFQERTADHTSAGDTLGRCLTIQDSVQTAPDVDLHAKDGTVRAIEGSAAPILGSDKQTIGAVLVFRDVTEQRRLVQEVAHRASHDWLTGLWNRAEFESQLQRLISDKQRRDCASLLFIDLDHFKRVNDSLGHAAGDDLLRDLASLMDQHTPDSARIGRLGGDEFGVLLEGQSRADALGIADRLCAAISDYRVRHGGHQTEIRIGASIGIVHLCSGPMSVAGAMRRADIAAYTAKNNGRGQSVVWAASDTAMQQISRQVLLVSRLETAIESSAFEIHAQPIVPADGDQTQSLAELLIRLRDEDGQLILPGDFVPAAERYGLAPRLDLWMVQQAIDLIRKGAKMPGQILSVNLSGVSLSSLGFQDDLLRLLSNVPRQITRRLCVEITETAVVENLAAASHLLNRLQEHEIKIALDDFGAGASSFRYLGDLPLDYLKIDGHFIDDLTDPIRLASLRCFVQMAEAAGLLTIAERVETAEQMQSLRGMGISLVQGYHIGRPKPVLT